MNPFVIDAFEFCRLNEHREAEMAVADLPRLVADCADKSGVLHWVLDGATNKFDYAQLTLSVSGEARMICQRCLTPYVFDIRSESILILAKNEVNADEIDALLDDETIDVIVGNKALNIFDLIEDEALLALPLSPKHDVCPDPAILDAFKNTKESPFSVLKDLKQ